MSHGLSSMPVPCVVVVCGGRGYSDWRTEYRQLDALHPTRIAHGGASGADQIADDYAYYRHIPCKAYLANWNKHGRAAGPIRNQEMLEAEQPHIVLALPGGKGTTDCISRARRMGIKVVEVAPDSAGDSDDG